MFEREAEFLLGLFFLILEPEVFESNRAISQHRANCFVDDIYIAVQINAVQHVRLILNCIANASQISHFILRSIAITCSCQSRVVKAFVHFKESVATILVRYSFGHILVGVDDSRLNASPDFKGFANLRFFILARNLGILNSCFFGKSIQGFRKIIIGFVTVLIHF